MTHTINSIREAFLSYFESKGHARLASAPLVPHNDPTLMFTNAGMVPFKHVFSGAETLKDKHGNIIRTATTSQKCVRAGGKHNDLDNVGYTTRHHTFFEMLGNFSFGDYFKEEAINHAWELLTQVFKLPPEKLYVTVYHTDDEAFNLWKKRTNFPDSKILRIPTNDNFWSMGDTGPCGPCSEIFYDHGVGKGEWALDENGKDKFDERYVEVWNLVFMQFEKLPDGSQINLPKPCIDTGMGLERMATVLQHIHDNYNTDLFKNLITAITHAVGQQPTPETQASYRVIADHLRSCCFLLADGVTPSNEGRGYVLRRIMRRGMRHAHLLGQKEPLMHRLVPALIAEMGNAYPELARAEALITETLKLEETRFKETLERGLKLLEDALDTMSTEATLAGDVAFKLYDTYGFPLDLTQDILRTKNITVDMAGFDAAMAEQKARARAAWSGSGSTAENTLWLELKDTFGTTEFLGYETLHASGSVLALVKDGAQMEQVHAGDHIMLLTNQTPFYAESGGQAGDIGVIHGSGGVTIRVTDVKKLAGSLHVHFGEVQQGNLRKGDTVEMKVDATRRMGLCTHHSATHLLHAALHQTLGKQVTQKGSLVEADYFRFDFNYPKGLSDNEKQQLEILVNQQITSNSAVTTRVMKPEEAIEAGAMALFGEKYGEEVRVLTMGSTSENKPYSIELCGGTHVKNTCEIQQFIITSESSVAAGIRRIEAATGEAAKAWLATKAQQKKEEEAKRKQQEAEKTAQAGALASIRNNFKTQIEKAEMLGNIAFLGTVLTDVSPKDLRILAEDFKTTHPHGVVVIMVENDGKASIVVGVSADAQTTHNAVELLRVGVEALGGKGGGGKADFAQGGAPSLANAESALIAIKKVLS